MSGRSNEGAGKRRRLPLPKMTSSGANEARRAKCSVVNSSKAAACHGRTAPVHGTTTLSVQVTVLTTTPSGPCRAIAFCPSIRSARIFMGGLSDSGNGLPGFMGRPRATPVVKYPALSTHCSAGALSVQPLLKSSKLANVCYDIRGPVLEKARQMEEEGQHIIKLNIGNLAVFGLEPPDEIVQDMIRNLPHTAGYTDSKGLFAPRRAVVHYTQQKHVKGVTVDDVFLGNGASELITMSMNALLNNGDEVLIPTPDYPLWTASVALSGGTPVHYLCDEAADWLPDIDDMAAKATPRTGGPS